MGKRIDGKCADLARKIWRLEGRCEATDVGMCRNDYVKTPNPQLQGAHIIGVGASKRLQADLRNGMSLCSACHRYWTSAPMDFSEFLPKTKYIKYLQPLRDKQNGPKVKVFWDERYEELKDIFRAVRDGELTLDEARDYEV